MDKAFGIGVALIAFSSSAFAQPVNSSPEQTPATATAAPDPSVVVVARDTPIELIATKEISTANATAGSQFTLSVNKALVINGRTVVPWGTRAIGEVTSASAAGGLGKTGKMTARLDYLQLGDARIRLQGDVVAKGQGAGSAGVAIVLGGWVGFFHRGNNARIKAGETVTAFVDEDVTLDLDGPTVHRIEPTGTSQPVAAPSMPSGSN